MTLPRFINGKFTAQATTGVQRAAQELVRALDDLGPQLPGAWTLLCPPGGEPPPLRYIACRTIGPKGLPLHAWEQAVLPWAARSGLLLNLAGAAPWFARRQLCMLYDAAVFDEPAAYSPAFRTWYQALFRHLGRSRATLATASEFSRQRLALALRVPAARLQHVPCGADHLLRVPADPAVLDRLGLLGQPFLLAVGSDNPTKNHAALVQAWGQLPTSPRLVIVGRRNSRVFAGTQGAAAAEPPGLLRTGPLSDGELKALYQAAMALVFPSRYEGFGIPPLEAMGLGCPVVAARAAALPETCGDAALWVDPADISALGAALVRVLGDEPERRRLVAEGRVRAGGFTWASAARQLLAVLPAEGRA